MMSENKKSSVKSIDHEALKKELRSLFLSNPETVMVFAARCALRVLPFTVVEQDFSYWGDQKREYITSIFLASMMGLGDRMLNDDLNRIILAVANSAVDAAGNTIKDAYYANVAAYDAAKAYLKKEFYFALSTVEAIDISVSDSVNETAFNDALESDLKQLQQNGLLFLKSKPLWHPKIPSEVKQCVSDWAKAMSALDLNEYVQIYSTLLHGRNYSKNHLQKLIKGWYRRYGHLYGKEQRATDPIVSDESDTELDSKSRTRYGQTHVHLHDELAEQDALGRQDLVDALATILEHKENHQHLTIGLLGDWGAGKSTFVKLLKDRLKEQNETPFLFAEFNAWEYEHTDHMQAGVAREALKGLTAKLSLGRKWKLALKFSVLEKAGHVIGTLSTTLLLLSIMIWGLNNQALLEWSTKDELLIGLLISVPLFWILFVVWKFHNSLSKIFKSPLVKAWKSYLSLPDYDAYLGTIPVMRHQIHALCQLQLKKHRLLFVVDDLDRCSHAGVVKTFEAVRLIMGISQVTVIIAIDHRIALASLALHYEKLAKHHTLNNSGNIARDYLGKVIQLPVQLPVADDKTVASFVDQMLFNEDEPSKPAGMSEDDGDKPLQTENGEENYVPKDTQSIDSNSHERETTETPSDEPQKPPEDKPDVIETVEYQLSPAEKTAFKDNVELFGFHNPRQLKRLYNSFNLLRHLKGSDQANDHMLVLFWLEYVNNLPVEERKTVRDGHIWKTVQQNFKQRMADYDAIEREVLPFVLPALDRPIQQDTSSKEK